MNDIPGREGMGRKAGRLLQGPLPSGDGRRTSLGAGHMILV